MRFDIKAVDDAPDEETWDEVWAPYLTEREVLVYRALRRENREVDASVFAREVGLSANAVRKALEHLKALELLEYEDET
ncbi:hypothetical protein LCGC14_2468370 [marine sediment metagenome]|uniref:HTH marR-type domain-containing protein n=1 Tax=marine sediment metagenome TaxID=412755 RepID=A0A0F9BB27_9ZZZZ